MLWQEPAASPIASSPTFPILNNCRQKVCCISKYAITYADSRIGSANDDLAVDIAAPERDHLLQASAVSLPESLSRIASGGAASTPSNLPPSFNLWKHF